MTLYYSIIDLFLYIPAFLVEGIYLFLNKRLYMPSSKGQFFYEQIPSFRSYVSSENKKKRAELTHVTN